MLRHENVSTIIVSVKFLHRMQILILKAVSMSIDFLVPPYSPENVYMGEWTQGWSRFYIVIFPHNSIPKNRDKGED